MTNSNEPGDTTFHNFEPGEKAGLNPKWKEISPPREEAGNEKLPVLEGADKSLNRLLQAIEARMIDPLTQIKNRGYWQKFQLEFDAVGAHHKIAIVAIDLDGFKEVNDSSSEKHLAGDKILRQTADFFRSVFRQGDDVVDLSDEDNTHEVVRVGGDEFLIIVHNTKNDPHFEQNLKLKMLELQKSDQVPNKFSFGVALFDKDLDGNLARTLVRADEKVYIDKNRNETKSSKIVKWLLEKTRKIFTGKSR